jgi:GNAT superfamily N-acetyltransferase
MGTEPGDDGAHGISSRRATIDDADALARIEVERGMHHGSIDPAFHLAHNPSWARRRPIPSLHLGIAVAASERGRRIGTKLMKHADRVAREQGCSRILLGMSSANVDALRFYEGLGSETYGLVLREELGAGRTSEA